MAEILNDYFSSVFTVEDTISTVQTGVISLNNHDYPGGIIKTLNDMKVDKTQGPDCSALRVQKETKHQIFTPHSIL